MRGGAHNLLSDQPSLIQNGILLLLVNSFTTYVTNAIFFLGQYFFRLLFVSMDIDNTQEGYAWLMEFLAQKHQEGRITSYGTLSVVNNKVNVITQNSWGRDKQTKSSKAEEKFLVVPGAGLHILYYSPLRWVFVHKSQSQQASQGVYVKETLWLGTLSWSDTFFRNLIQEARSYCVSHDAKSTVVYIQDRGGYSATWAKALSKNVRTWESVILDNTMGEEVYNDVFKFLNNQQWYSNLGVPYRRSYLLESPPGCGKSSFIAALAGRLNFDICFLSLSEQGLSDSGLAALLRNAPSEAIILLEDLDVAFPDRTLMSKEEIEKEEKSKTMRPSMLTMSGLLNAIDGLVASEGKLLFFTTNHIEKLDPALLRPGRVDKVVSLKLASHNQIEKLFVRFFPKSESVAKLYARGIPEFQLSMAQIQNHLLQFDKQPIECVKDLPRFLAEVKASQLRREQYEKKEAAKRGELKTEVPQTKPEAVPVLEKVLEKVVDTSKKTEEKRIDKEKEEEDRLSMSLQGLDNESLTRQVNTTSTVTKRNKKKKKRAQLSSSLNE